LESLLSTQDKTLSDDIKAKHKIIHRNTKRLKRLIDELMDFRKMQFSKIQLRVKESNLIEIIDNVVSYYEEEALYRNISLKVKYDTLINPIWIDPTMLEKIIFNLLSNAFKATHEGGNILITVGYHENGVIFPLIDHAQLQSAFEITIEDSGIGIKKENIRKIFERFYQDKDNNKQYFGGTGIGLEVVKKFVDYHKGMIQVESQQDVGTSFKILFAAGNDHFSENEFSSFIAKKSSPENKIQKAINGSEEKNVIDSENLEQSILIVEDNMELREYLKLELKNQYRIFEASNGKIGFDMARKVKPDVIIADVMMPEMDGVQMCSLVKGNPSTSNIPVLMLTAKVAEKERIEGIDSGADVYLKKPFSVNLLKSHLRQLIRSKDSFYQTYFKSLDLEIDTIGHDKKILADVINVIGNNLSKEDLCVQDIADELGLSRSKLYRKIKALTGKSANQIIRNIRLEKSKELLSMTDMTIGEICFKVGFASPSYFTKRFREYTNTIPKEYRQENIEKKQNIIE
jgi:CheY-like chemotaxis protein/AraC-like DNA-binding protein